MPDRNKKTGTTRSQITASLVMGLVMMALVMLMFMRDAPTFICMAFLCFGAFLGMVIAGGIIQRVRLRRMVAKAEIVGLPAALGQGDCFAITYRQVVKKVLDVIEVSARLELHESATYTRGTDRVTEQHAVIVDEHILPGQHVAGGAMLELPVSFCVPGDAMHSFQAKNNKLAWMVVFEVMVTGWPHHYTEEFLVTVDH